MKLVCVVNQSLKMGKGKIAAQVGHASIQAFLGAGVSHPQHVEAWLAEGQKKICVKTPKPPTLTPSLASLVSETSPFISSGMQPHADSERLCYGAGLGPV